jgi:phosphomannomutase
MARLGAVFGGEHSAHFYFRDFFFADSGMLAAMHVLAALGTQTRPLSELLAPYSPYVASGEINSRVSDADEATRRVVGVLAGADCAIDEFDGVTIDHWSSEPRWWLNVRASNTEPLLRLNVEAADRDVMEHVRDRALAIIREG